MTGVVSMPKTNNWIILLNCDFVNFINSALLNNDEIIKNYINFHIIIWNIK